MNVIFTSSLTFASRSALSYFFVMLVMHTKTGMSKIYVNPLGNGTCYTLYVQDMTIIFEDKLDADTIQPSEYSS